MHQSYEIAFSSQGAQFPQPAKPRLAGFFRITMMATGWAGLGGAHNAVDPETVGPMRAKPSSGGSLGPVDEKLQ
jgi:hypothetical protein